MTTQATPVLTAAVSPTPLLFPAVLVARGQVLLAAAILMVGRVPVIRRSACLHLRRLGPQQHVVEARITSDVSATAQVAGQGVAGGHVLERLSSRAKLATFWMTWSFPLLPVLRIPFQIS